MTTFSLLPLHLQDNSEIFKLQWNGNSVVEIEPSGVTLYGKLNGAEIDDTFPNRLLDPSGNLFLDPSAVVGYSPTHPIISLQNNQPRIDASQAFIRDLSANTIDSSNVYTTKTKIDSSGGIYFGNYYPILQAGSTDTVTQTFSFVPLEDLIIRFFYEQTTTQNPPFYEVIYIVYNTLNPPPLVNFLLQDKFWDRLEFTIDGHTIVTNNSYDSSDNWIALGVESFPPQFSSLNPGPPTLQYALEDYTSITVTKTIKRPKIQTRFLDASNASLQTLEASSSTITDLVALTLSSNDADIYELNCSQLETTDLSANMVRIQDLQATTLFADDLKAVSYGSKIDVLRSSVDVTFNNLVTPNIIRIDNPPTNLVEMLSDTVAQSFRWIFYNTNETTRVYHTTQQTNFGSYLTVNKVSETGALLESSWDHFEVQPVYDFEVSHVSLKDGTFNALEVSANVVRQDGVDLLEYSNQINNALMNKTNTTVNGMSGGLLLLGSQGVDVQSGAGTIILRYNPVTALQGTGILEYTETQPVGQQITGGVGTVVDQIFATELSAVGDPLRRSLLQWDGSAYVDPFSLKADASHVHAWADITNPPAIPSKTSELTNDSNFMSRSQCDASYVLIGGPAGSVAWGDITSKPESFPPSSHGHSILEITGLHDSLMSLPTRAEIDASFSLLGHTHTYSEIAGKPDYFPTNKIRTGVTTSPPSGVEGEIYYATDVDKLYTHNGTSWQVSSGSAAWNDITGKPPAFEPLQHSHFISDIANLQDTLNTKMTRAQCDASYALIGSGSGTYAYSSLTGIPDFFVTNHLQTGIILSPPAGISGDIFYSLNDQKVYVHNGTEWLPVQGSASSVGWNDVQNKPSSFTAGKFVSNIGAPSAGTGALGDVCYDSILGNFYLRYSSGWAPISSFERISSDPALTQEGRTYFNTTDKKAYVFNGTTWKPLNKVNWSDIEGTQSSIQVYNFGGSLSTNQVSGLDAALDSKLTTSSVIPTGNLNFSLASDPVLSGVGSRLGQVWYNSSQKNLKVNDDGIARVVQFINVIQTPKTSTEMYLRKEPTINNFYKLEFTAPVDTDPLMVYSVVYCNPTLRSYYITMGQSYQEASWFQELYPVAIPRFDSVGNISDTSYRPWYGTDTSYRHAANSRGFTVTLNIDLTKVNTSLQRPSALVPPSAQEAVNLGQILLIKHNRQTPFTTDYINGLLTSSSPVYKLELKKAFADVLVLPSEQTPIVPGKPILSEQAIVTILATFSQLGLGWDQTWYNYFTKTLVAGRPTDQGTTTPSNPSGNSSINLPVNYETDLIGVNRQLSDGSIVEDLIPVFGVNAHSKSVFAREYIAKYNNYYQDRGSYGLYLVDQNNLVSFLPTSLESGIYTYVAWYNPPQFSDASGNTIKGLPMSRHAVDGTTVAARYGSVKYLDASLSWQDLGAPLTPILGFKECVITSNETLTFKAFAYPQAVQELWGSLDSLYQFATPGKIFELYGNTTTSWTYDLFRRSFCYMKYGHVAYTDVVDSFMNSTNSSDTTNSLYAWWLVNVYGNRTTYNLLAPVLNTRPDGMYVVGAFRYNALFWANQNNNFTSIITTGEFDKLKNKVYQ